MLGSKTKSIKIFLFFNLMSVSLAPFSAAQNKPSTSSGDQSSCLSVSDAVGAALNASESIKIQQSEAIAAAEQHSAAKAAVLPTLKASAAVVKQDDSQAKSGSSQESYPTTAKLAVNQPIYAGGAEYAALRKASQQAEAGAKLADGARIKVAKDALSKVFQVLIAQSELRSSTELRELSKRRLKNIQSRVAIGRSKSADGFGAEAQVANSDAQFEAARLSLESARRQLSSLIGRDVASVCEIQPKTSVALKSWSDVRSKVLQRSDVLAADLSASAAGEGVAIARAGHQPSVDIGGNYYFKRLESQ